jgi:hypothetical protein
VVQILWHIRGWEPDLGVCRETRSLEYARYLIDVAFHVDGLTDGMYIVTEVPLCEGLADNGPGFV